MFIPTTSLPLMIEKGEHRALYLMLANTANAMQDNNG